LIKTFLPIEVDVNKIEEICFKTIVNTTNVELLELLLQRDLNNHLVFISIFVALSTTSNYVRLRLVTLLMNYSVRKEFVVCNLIKALAKDESLTDFVLTLLQDRIAIDLLVRKVVSIAI